MTEFKPGTTRRVFNPAEGKWYTIMDEEVAFEQSYLTGLEMCRRLKEHFDLMTNFGPTGWKKFDAWEYRVKHRRFGDTAVNKVIHHAGSAGSRYGS